MKILVNLILLMFLNAIGYSQSILPSPDNEYCPGTEITFTVKIPGTFESIIGNGGCYVTVQPFNFSSSEEITTFNFKGKFSDVNIAQSFTIEYKTGTVFQNYTKPYKRIKSLFYSTSCTPIQPNQTVIIAPRCEIVNIPLSFNNVQWSTAFETPSMCFGSITAYEYLLPTGWSIGPNISNGSSWIAGGNNVTITSDLSNGVNGSVYIRPVNTCGAALQDGRAQTVQIPISRPAPTLTIPETQTEICSGSKVYTLTGLPPGASTSWSISTDYGVASISNPNNTSVTVHKTGAGNGHETLTATVTHCSFVYQVSKILKFGVPTTTFDIFTYLPLYADCFELDAFYVFKANLLYSYDVYPSSYQWSYRLNGTTSETIVSSKGRDGVFMFPNTGTYDVIVRPVTSCGVGSTPSVKTIYVQSGGCGGMGLKFSVAPNPAQGHIFVTFNEQATSKTFEQKEKAVFQLYDLNRTSLVRQWIKEGGDSRQKLNINGIRAGHYILVVQKGKEQVAKPVIIIE